MKLNTWICDSCGGEILSVDQGWVEWLGKYDASKKKIGKGLRLVHHYISSPHKGKVRCQYDQDTESKNGGFSISDHNLKDFLGDGGLMDLLALLSDHELPDDEVIEMIKRLHIPGYEQARGHFDEAIADGVFEPNTKPGFYNISDIEATTEWLEKKEKS